MKRMPRFALCVVISLIASTTANAQKDKLVGTFLSTDPLTRGITRVTVSPDNKIHVWAKCSRKECDWGTVPVILYGPNVVSDLRTSASALSATYTPGFAVKMVIAVPLTKNKLQVDVFTNFVGQSRRTSFVSRQILVREGKALKQ